MTSKTISVIMSVYNNEPYLALAIESVLEQTFGDFELIITDDASTDRSSQIIKHYADLDQRIVFYKNDCNLGLTRNLNRMLSIAKGQYVARMDGDDICDLERFQKQVDVLSKYPNIDVVFTDTILIDAEGDFICKKWIPKSVDIILSLMPVQSYIAHPSVTIRREILEQDGGYNERYKVAQDWELWLRLIGNKRNFYYLQHPLLFYRLHANSVSAGKFSNESYNKNKYKLAKTCISNNQYRAVFKYWSDLNFIEQVLIVIRMVIPKALVRWFRYIFRRYHPNSVIKQLHRQGL